MWASRAPLGRGHHGAPHLLRLPRPRPSRLQQYLPSKAIFNPLLPNGNYSYHIIKNSFSKKKGIMEKNSYEYRVYESVQDENLSIRLYLKI